MNISMHAYYKDAVKLYKSRSQIARVVTENWCRDNMYCPFCNNTSVKPFENNKKVYDFFCDNCGQQYQLKSKFSNIGKSIPDGEYHTMIRAINENRTPNLLLLSYLSDFIAVKNLVLLPKNLLFPNNIIKRKQLSVNARRAGWTGCNIDISGICDDGKVKIIEKGIVIDFADVRAKVHNIERLFSSDFKTGSWLNDILLIVTSQKEYFDLDKMYSYSDFLKLRHPENNNIRAKIRQQLQFLRDEGYVEFLDRGNYRRLR